MFFFNFMLSDSECSDKMIEDESYIPYPSSPSPKKKFEKKINDSVISNEVPYPEASVDLRESSINKIFLLIIYD